MNLVIRMRPEVHATAAILQEFGIFCFVFVPRDSIFVGDKREAINHSFELSVSSLHEAIYLSTP